MTLSKEIYRFIVESVKPVRLGDIWRSMKLPRDLVWQHTQKLLNTGLIYKIEEGVYALHGWKGSYIKPPYKEILKTLYDSKKKALLLREISTQSGISIKSTWKMLQKLMRDQEVWKVDRGVYALKETH